MSIQEYIDYQLSDSEIRSVLRSYLSVHPSIELETLLFRTPSKVIRAEFYVNVAAGCVLSSRTFYTDGFDHDGPIYGYALSLGIRAEKLNGALEYIRDYSLEKVLNYLHTGE